MKTKIKNFLCVMILTIALMLSSNFSLAFCAVNGIRNLARAEYKPTDTITPYEFTSTSGWSSRTNAPSNSNLSNAFQLSSVSADLYNKSETLPITPSEKYNGDVLQFNDDGSRETTIDDYALTLQAQNAPKKETVNKTDKNGNTVYEKDEDGNFIFERKVYKRSEINDEDLPSYEIIPGTETYYKKLNDSEGNTTYELVEEDSNGGNTDLYVYNEQTKKYNKKVPQKEEVNSYYGFRTQSTITLRADCWYVFSFWIWTKNTNATVVVYSGETFKTKVEVSNTNGEWKKFYLFIEGASDNSTSVNIAVYYGSEDAVMPDLTQKDIDNGIHYTDGEGNETTQNDQSKMTTGAIFLDNVCVRNISESDFKKLTIKDEEFPDEGKYAKQKDSLRKDYNDLSGIDGSFQNELGLEDIYPKMRGEDDYKSLEDDDAPTYPYERYISLYTDDNASEKQSDNQLRNMRRAYETSFNFETVLEKEVFEEDELGEDGEPKKDEEGNVIKKPGPDTFTSVNEETGEIPANSILKLENTSEAYELGLLSAKIPIMQFGYYRLTVYVKSKSVNDNVTIKLLSKIRTGSTAEKGALQVKSQSLSAYTDNSDITNNWTEITFYIQGNCYYDHYMQIAILAGTESTIYVDNLRLETITSDTYRNQSSAKRFDLAPSSTTYTSRIENGFFNSVTTSSVDPDKIDIPYSPYGWTKLDGSSSTVVAGVVSTDAENFYEKENLVKDKDGNPTTIKEKLGGAEIPYSYYDGIQLPSNNVLAIYSPSKEKMDAEDLELLDKDWKGHYYGYKSSQFSLSSNSVYEITFEVYLSQDSAFEGKIFANLIYAEKHVGEMVYSFQKAQSSKEWQTYKFLVRTGSSSRTFSLELGVQDATEGTVFFQKVNYKQYSEKTDPNDSEKKITVDDQYNEIYNANLSYNDQIANKVRFVNFDGDSTVMHSADKAKIDDEQKDYYTSLSYALREGDNDEEIIQGELGIVDTSAEFKLNSDKTYAANELQNKSVQNPLVMMLYNKENYYTAAYPNTNTTLSSSSYYQISVWVRTIGIEEGSGLTITMSTISTKFENINTEKNEYSGLEESNGYVKLTTFVKTGSSSISGLRMALELGSEDKKITGLALISGIEIKKIEDEEDYNTLVEAVDENDTTTVVKDFNIDTDDNESSTGADNLTLVTFFLVFSSLLLVAALIFAICAVYIKRVPKVAKAKADEEDNTPKDGFV